MMNTKEQRRFEKEIDIVPLLRALLSKLWIIVLIGILFSATAYTSAKIMIKPTYRCGFTAYVNNQHAQSEIKDTLTYSDLTAAMKLTQTYSYILRSNSVLGVAAKSIGSNMSYGALKKRISTEVQKETEVISVYITDEDPEFAYALANAITVTAPDVMTNIVEGSSMKIIDSPVMPTSRFGPSYIRYALLGFFVGAALVILMVMINYFRDDTIKSEMTIEQRFAYPILGVLPYVTDASRKGDGDYYDSYGKSKKSATKDGGNKNEKR